MKLLSKFRGLHRSLLLFSALLLIFGTVAPLAKAFADAADPVIPIPQGQVVHNGDGTTTVTMSGQWQWTTHNSDCNTNRWAVGWAIDWHDASQPGNLVQNGAIIAHVGTPTDNTVHFMHKQGDSNPNGDPVGATRCGIYDAGLDYNTGAWGPISHTYPAGFTDISACVVTYDIHEQNDGPKSGDLIAGGAGHNDDNSVEKNGNTPLGNGCFSPPPPAPNLTLVKHVTNDNGGSANASAWTLTASGSGGFSGTGSPATGADASISQNVTAGVEYTLSESGGPPSGYSSTGTWNCSGGGAFVSPNKVTMASGQNETCTITNDDTPPSLTLNKIVSNTHGGNAAESAWTVSATGPTSISGSGAAGSADVVSGSNFSAGTYTLGESAGPSGYSASTWSCTNGVTVNGQAQITLTNGQSTVCTITNSDIAPSLVVNKVVNNPYGNGTPPLSISAFPLFVTGISGTTQVTSGQSNQFSAGNYTVSETQQYGYQLTSGVCDGQNSLSLTLSVGDNKSCTLTNTAIQPQLIVKKHVVGGNKTASQFTMTVTGNTQAVAPFNGDENGTTVGLNEGSYSADETTDNDYVKLRSADCTGSISIGETKTCIITNILKGKVDICHATDSNSNPYVVNHPNKSGDVSGHDGHNGPIWFPGIDEDWGDIIPPFDYVDNNGDVQHYLGKNWTSLGQSIHDNDCEVVPGIHVVKDGPNTAHEGDKVTYTFTVTNTGNIPLGDINVNDDVAGAGDYQSGDTNNDQMLDLDETWIYEKQFTIPADTQEVNNTATACSDDSDVCDADNHHLTVLHPAIHVDKYGPNTAYRGDTVTYEFYVTNTGDTELHNVGVADDIAIGEICDATVLAPDDSTWCSATYTIPSDQTGDVANHVTASGTDKLDKTVTDTDQHTLIVLVPGIHVVKSGPATASPGQTVTYTFTVTNTGNTPLDSITVNDNVAGIGIYQSGDTNNDSILQTTETWIYTAKYTIPANQNVSVTNTVEACGLSSNPLNDEQIERIILDIAGRKVCDQDNHTTNIPLVLGTSTPPKLVNTGQNAMFSIFAGLSVICMVGTLAWAPKKR